MKNSQNSNVKAIVPQVETRAQFCIRCGKGAPDVKFRSPQALKCNNCGVETVDERKEYHRVYHKIRNRAISELISLHPTQFARLTEKYRVEVEAEEAGE